MNPEDLLKPFSELTEREREILRKRLATLTEKERQVLQAFYDALDSSPAIAKLYDTIGKKLHLGESTVKTYMGRICIKLGIDELELHPLRQKIALYQAYYPLLKKAELPPAPLEETAEPEPLPESVIRMVEELERALVLGEQTVPETVGEPQPSSQPKRSQWLRWLLVGVILGTLVTVCLTAGVIFAFRGLLWGEETPQAQATPAPPGEYREGTPEVTVEVIPTLTPPQPTPTSEEVVVVVTATPQDTPTPAPPTPTPAPTDTPVPPTPTSMPTATVPEDTPPGSILEEGESWQQNNVRLRLDKVKLDAPRECVTLMFNLFNDTDHTIVVTINSQNFSVVDNLDRKWRFSSIGFCTYGCSGRDEEIVDTVEASERFRTEGCDTWKASFNAFLTDTNVNEIIVTVDGLPEISNARWRIPIYN